MKSKRLKTRAVFNASVIFSALLSSVGASRGLLALLKDGRIDGIISETILDEALKHADKIPMEKEEMRKKIDRYFPRVLPAPGEAMVSRYKDRMLDINDAHLFATYKESRSDYLVSLDKRHILSLQKKIKGVRIVSPKELIERLR